MNKLSVLSLLGVFLAVVAVASGYRPTMQITTFLSDGAKMCLKKIADENHDYLGRNQYDDNDAHDAHRCYDACVWKHAGLFANNTFNLDKMVPNNPEGVNQDIRRVIRTIIYACVGSVYEIPDECEKAAEYTRCVRNMVQQSQQFLAHIHAHSKSHHTTPASA